MGKWIPWSGLDRDKGGQWILAPNPIIPTLYLWVGAKGVVWIPRKKMILKISRPHQPLSLPIKGPTFVYNFLKHFSDCREDYSVYGRPSPSDIHENSLADQRDKNGRIPNSRKTFTKYDAFETDLLSKVRNFCSQP